MKKAIVTGAAGQQGFFLCDLLLKEGYSVNGIINFDSDAIDEQNWLQHGLHTKVDYTHYDMGCDDYFWPLYNWKSCDEIYNLAAINDLNKSFLKPSEIMRVNYGGFAKIVESVSKENKECKVFQAGSSEMFGDPIESPQNELTTFKPRNPYGISKVAAYQLAKMYRERGLKIYNGIIFNNDSERRGEQFLTRKVCRYVAAVANGKKNGKLKVGNLSAKRDFGYAKEYAEWIYRIMQHSEPEDFIMATGITNSAADFISEAFKYVGIDNWIDYVEVDEMLYRKSEAKLLVGDASKSKRLLDFAPKTTFKELISIMMEHELKQYDK